MRKKGAAAGCLVITYSLVLQGQTFSAPMVALITNSHLFQEDQILLAQPNYEVQSRVSVGPSRTFVSAGDLWFLSDEFKSTTLSTVVGLRTVTVARSGALPV
jgi:hypothetical protein